MNIVKFVIFMAGVALISACSKAPSESDAKKIVLSQLGDCSHLSLGHFEKTNGVQMGEQGYKVDVAYSVKVMPFPEIKQMISPQLAESYERMKKAEAEYNNGTIDYKVFQETAGEWVQIERPIEAAIKNKWDTACPNLDPELSKLIFSKEDDVAKFAQELTKEFSGTVVMMKTDNGWQAAR